MWTIDRQGMVADEALLQRISSYNELKPELLGVIDASATLLKAAAEKDKQAFGSRLFAAIPWKQISDPYTRLIWLEIIESDKQEKEFPEEAQGL
ncbi:MAG: hypothetical protein ACOVKV_17440, partial [Novosphingobium sp.]